MMKSAHITVVAALIFATLPVFVSAQSDFFLSFSGLNEGAVNKDVEIELRQGQQRSIYIYYTTNGPANSEMDPGAFLDFFSSSSDVVQFLAAETFSFSIRTDGSPSGRYRWGNHPPKESATEKPARR